jgi:hypothetical protein
MLGLKEIYRDEQLRNGMMKGTMVKGVGWR